MVIGHRVTIGLVFSERAVPEPSTTWPGRAVVSRYGSFPAIPERCSTFSPGRTIGWLSGIPNPQPSEIGQLFGYYGNMFSVLFSVVVHDRHSNQLAVADGDCARAMVVVGREGQ